MRELRISIKLDQDFPEDDESLQDARRAALEAAVLKLWQAGHLSTREAASRLGLSYYDYLDFLGAKGIPIVMSAPEEGEIDELMRELDAEQAS
jgi:hypothetical protein